MKDKLKKNGKLIFGVISSKSAIMQVKAIIISTFLIINLFSSCTTTRMTISSLSYKSAFDDIDSEISSLGDYKLSGSGSETKNEIVVLGQSYTQFGGYSTLMDNNFAIYENYMYIDSLGKTIDFQIKRKNRNDYNGIEYIYDIEVVKCNCIDKRLYPSVCGENGIVKKITKLKPDQQSYIYDSGKTIISIFGISLAASLLFCLPLLAL